MTIHKTLAALAVAAATIVSAIMHTPTSGAASPLAAPGSATIAEDKSGVQPLALYVNIKPVSAPTRCLDVAGGNTGGGAIVQQWDCIAGNTNQQWHFVDVGSGYNQIRARHSDRCLAVAEANDGGGAAIIQSACVSGATHQHWSLVAEGSGHYNLKVRHSLRCASVAGSTLNGANIQTWSCLSGDVPSQSFTFVSV